MNGSTITQRVPTVDKARIAFTGCRYDFWLDLRWVPDVDVGNSDRN